MTLSLRTSLVVFAISTLSVFLVTGCDSGTQSGGSPAQSSGTSTTGTTGDDFVPGGQLRLRPSAMQMLSSPSCASSDPDLLCLGINKMGVFHRPTSERRPGGPPGIRPIATSRR